jgi:hypothetical protein
MLLAAPHMALPAKNNPIQVMSAERRPNASASPPEKGKKAVDAKAYAEPTQTNSDLDDKAEAMVGSALGTARSSIAERNRVRLSEENMIQKRLPLPSRFAGGAGAFMEGMGYVHNRG